MDVPTHSSQELQSEFLTLMVAQLRNQDPLEPVPQQDFLSQLAQFSTLESVEGLNSRFDDLLQLEQLSYGSDLIGKTVLYDTERGPQSGAVQAVVTDNGSLFLDVNGEFVAIQNVLGIAQ